MQSRNLTESKETDVIVVKLNRKWNYISVCRL